MANFDILAKGRSDTYCKIKETLLIRELKLTLNQSVNARDYQGKTLVNDNVSSEKLSLF